MDSDHTVYLPPPERTSSELPLISEICEKMNIYSSDLHSDWKELYYTWAEKSSWYSFKDLALHDPHEPYYKFLPWRIRYHPSSIQSLKNHDPGKIVDSILRFGSGNEKLESLKESLLKVIIPIDDQIKMAALVEIDLGEEEEAVNSERRKLKGTIIVLEIGNDLVCDEAISGVTEFLGREKVKNPKRVIAMHRIEKDLEIFMRIREDNKFAIYKEFEKYQGNQGYVTEMYNFISEAPRIFQLEICAGNDQGEHFKYNDIPIEIIDEESDVFVFRLEEQIYVDSSSEAKLMLQNELWRYFFAIINNPNVHLSMEDMLYRFKQEIASDIRLQGLLMSTTLPALNDFLTHYGKDVLDEQTLKYSLVIYSFCIEEKLLRCPIEASKLVLTSMKQYQLVGWKESKYFNEMLAMISQHIMSYKSKYEYATAAELFKDVEDIGDDSISSLIFEKLFEILKKSSGELMKSDINIIQQYLKHDSDEKIIEMSYMLSLWSNDFTQTLDFLKILNDKGIEITEKHSSRITKLLTKFFVASQNPTILAKIIQDIFGNATLIPVFKKANFTKRLQETLNRCISRAYLENYKTIFFSCYIEEIVENTYREKYILDRIKDQTITFSDFSEFFKAGLVEISISACRPELFVACFESCANQVIHIMSNEEYFTQAMSHLENLQSNKSINLYPILMKTLFTKVSSDLFEIILLIMNKSPGEALVQAYKSHFPTQKIASYIAEFEKIYQVFGNSKIELIQWTLTKLAERIEPLKKNQFEEKILKAPSVTSYLFYILEQPDIFRSTKIFQATHKFLCEFWQSLAAGNETITISTILLINEAQFENIAYYIAKCTYSETEERIVDRITQITIMYLAKREIHDSLDNFFSNYCRKIKFLEETSKQFAEFKAACLGKSLKDYTPPITCVPFYDISYKLFPLAESKLFNKSLTEDKNIDSCKDAKTLNGILERLFNELKTKFEEFCVCKDGMKIKSIVAIFQIDEDMQKEIEICEKAFNKEVDAKLKSCLSHLYEMSKNIDIYQSILNLDDVFRLGNQEFKSKCKDYLTLVSDYENQTAESFTSVSEAVKKFNNPFALLNNPRNFRIFKEFSKSNLLLKFLFEKKGGVHNIDDETFFVLKDGLEDKEYDPSLTKEDIDDLEKLWKFMRTIGENITTEEFIEKIQERLKEFVENLKCLESCLKNFNDINVLYCMQTNKEEHKKEIIKKICEFSIVELNNNCVSLVYQKDSQKPLTLHELLDLKNKSSIEIIKQKRCDTEDQNSLIINEAFIKFVEILKNLESTVKNLYHLGYTNIPKQVRFECSGREYEQLSRFQQEISNKHKEWTLLLIKSYKDNFWLTFLSGQEFWKIDDFIRGQAPDNLTIFLLQFMEKDYKAMDGGAKQIFQKRLLAIESQDQTVDSLSIFSDKLTLIGSFLEAMPDTIPRKYDFTSVLEERNAIKFDGEKIVIYQGESLFDGLVSIYVNSDAEMPRLHQVLYCKKETPWREINSFLYRWFASPKPVLYAIIECENLKIKYQAKFLELFIELFKQCRENKIFKPFAILTKSVDSEIAIKLKHQAKIKLTKIKDNQILTEEKLRKVIAIVDNFTQVHTSACVGLGKTTRIRKLAEEQNLVYREILVAGELSYSSIGNLFQFNNFESKILFHLCIGTVEDTKYIEEVIQSLSIFRMLITKTNKFCLSEGNMLCIEIENTPDNWLYKDINYLEFLQNYTIRSLDASSFVYTRDTEHVGKYLVLRKTERILNESLYYSNGSECNITSDEIKQAIIEQIQYQQTIKEVNFYQITIFFRFIFITMKYFEENSFFNNFSISNLIEDLNRRGLKEIGMKLKPTRGNIVKAIFDAADYFTLKQVKSILYSQSNSETDIVKDEEINIQLDTKDSLCLVFCKDGELLIIKDLEDATAEIKILITVQECVINKINEDKGKWFFNKKYDLKGMIEHRIKNKEYTLEDYSNMTDTELRAKLIKIVNPVRSTFEEKTPTTKVGTYVLTFDNFTKMILIYYKSLAKIPIVIMGETGCGKTALLQYFVKEILNEEILVFSINAGTTLESIDGYMQDAIAKAKKMPSKNLWIFFDEFNTTPCITYLCQIICEKRYNTIPLPDNIVVTAACNPYRTKKVSETEEIGIKKQSRMYKKTSKLVHNVKRLPNNVIEYIWNFGALNTDTFCSYVASMLNDLYLGELSVKVVKLIQHAHEYFVKKVDKSSISLRDVARFIDIYKWFTTIRTYPGYKPITISIVKNLKRRISISDIDDKTRCIILSFVHCFYLRISLKAERETFLAPVYQTLDISKEKLLNIVRDEQEFFLECLPNDEGIAKNSALRENIFAVFPCIMNRIPVFICGKPGCSKSLSVNYLCSNLKGNINSKHPFLRHFPKVLLVPFQGSESCTSEGVESIFKKAYKLYEDNSTNKKDTEILPVILFDEIGLAEISVHNPLKVLHRHLEHENKKIGFIGISNWALDASKMNRALYLARPEPELKDLKETASALCSALLKLMITLPNIYEKYINSASEIYLKVQTWIKNHRGSNSDFYGLRDFYHTIKYISREFKHSQDPQDLNRILFKAFERNFGGRLDAIRRIEIFLKELIEANSMEVKLRYTPVLELIKENIEEEGSRYLMIIAQKEVAMYLLENERIVSSSNRKVMIGSSFESDQNKEETTSRQISEVIRYLDTDSTLIFMDMDSIYTSLYDLFNQNFTKGGSRNYCKIALGAHFNARCCVHEKFKCIVFLEDDDNVIASNDPPFLNRFEKHWVNLDQILTDQYKEIVKELDEWVDSIVTLSDGKGEFDSTMVFPIYSKGYSPYLVLRHGERYSDHVLERCKGSLLKVSSVDLLFLLDVIDILTGDKEKIKKQWEETHKETFIEMANRPVYETTKVIALTYDSVSVQSLIESVDAVHFQILSNFNSEKHLKSDISQFYLSEDMVYIIEMDYSKEAKHLMMLKSEINSTIANNIALDKKKKFIIIVRMHRNDKQRIPIRFDLEWEMTMYEDLKNSQADLTAFQDKTITSMISEDTLFNFRANISELTENALLSFKYESLQTNFEPHEYKYKILKSIEDSEELTEDLKTKAINIVKSKYVSLNYESWKISIFTEPKITAEAFNLYNALELIVKKELQQGYSLVLFILEKEFSLYSYINSYLNYPQLRAPSEKYFNRINSESIRMKQGNNNNILYYIHELSVPFIYDAYQKLNECYWECLEEKTEASNQKEKMSRLLGDKDTLGLKELLKDDDIQKLIIQDFIRVVLYENSQESNHLDLLYQAIKSLVFNKDNFDVLLDVIIHQEILIEMSNVFVLLVKLNSNDPSILESLQEDLSREEISDKLETNIEKILDCIIFKLNPSSLKLNEVASQYLPLLENMFIILGRIIKTHKLSTKKIFILEFWIEFSRIHPFSVNLKQISDKINECRDQDFICQDAFLKCLEDKLQKSPFDKNKFRVFILHQLILRDPIYICNLFREINDKTNNLWKVSSKCMDLIIDESNLLDAYYRITYEHSSEFFSEYDLNDYLKQIESVIPGENQFESQFCVLLSDRIYRALQDPKITQMIASEINEECILDDSIKIPLEFFIKYYYYSANICPNLTKLICGSKICEYLELYADYLLRTEKYTDDANVSEIFENLFASTRDGKSFGNYCLKKIKDMCGNSYEKLRTLAQERRGSRLMKTVPEEKCTEFIYVYLPFLEYSNTEEVEQLITTGKKSADFTSYIKGLKNKQDENPENNPKKDKEKQQNQEKILSVIVCFLRKLYTSHLGTNLAHLIPDYQAEFEKNPSKIATALGKNNFQLLKCFLYNFAGKENWKYLPLVSVNHENNKRNIILSFAISIMSVYKNSDCVLTTPFNIISKEPYSLKKLIASRLSICDESNRDILDLKFEISLFWKYEQYYRCPKNCLCFMRKDLPERKCKVCGDLVIEDSVSGLKIIESINEKLAKLIITKKFEDIRNSPIEKLLQIPMEASLSFYLKELLILSYAYFLTIIGEILPEPDSHNPENLLQAGIEVCFLRIKETINCKNYYTFMLSFLSKLALIMNEKLTFLQFNQEFDEIITKTSHAELSNNYKESYSNSYFKSSKAIFLDLEEITTYLELVNPIRIKQEISVENFKRVYSSQVEKAKYPYVKLYLSYQDKINTLQSLCSILDFTNSLLRDFSFQISRADAGKKNLASILTDNKILNDKFEKFTEAWKKLSTIKLSFEEKALPYCELSEDLTLNYFLVDTNPDDNGRYIAAALVYLGKLNNEILESIKEFTSEKMINRSPVQVQKLKSTNIIRFDFNIDQVVEDTWVINPKYGMGEEVLYDFERIEYNVKKSLQRGRIVDTENLSCIQYTNEILNSHSKYRGVINEIRRNVPQTDIPPQILSSVTKLLEAIKEKKELHNSMNKLLVVIQERKIDKPDSVENLCKIIKFKLHQVFTQKSMGAQRNVVASLSISNIIHLHEIIEELAFPDLLDTVSKKYTSAISMQAKKEIVNCLKTIEKGFGIYPTAQEIRKAVVKFIIRCLMEDLDVEQKIITYLVNPSFWNYTEEQMKKVERLKNDFKDIFKVLKLSGSIEVYKTVNEHLASRNAVPAQESPLKERPNPNASIRRRGGLD